MSLDFFLENVRGRGRGAPVLLHLLKLSLPRTRAPTTVNLCCHRRLEPLPLALCHLLHPVPSLKAMAATPGKWAPRRAPRLWNMGSIHCLGF